MEIDKEIMIKIRMKMERWRNEEIEMDREKDR
jgi:hypothetical protein